MGTLLHGRRRSEGETKLPRKNSEAQKTRTFATKFEPEQKEKRSKVFSVRTGARTSFIVTQV